MGTCAFPADVGRSELAGWFGDGGLVLSIDFGVHCRDLGSILLFRLVPFQFEGWCENPIFRAKEFVCEVNVFDDFEAAEFALFRGLIHFVLDQCAHCRLAAQLFQVFASKFVLLCPCGKRFFVRYHDRNQLRLQTIAIDKYLRNVFVTNIDIFNFFQGRYTLLAPV